MPDKTKIDYRVRPVTRYLVTRCDYIEHSNGTESSGSSTGHGEFDNADTAYAVAYALAKQEHDALGWPAFDDRMTYPTHPRDLKAVPVKSI